ATGVDEVFVLDPTFNANPGRFRDVVDAMRAAGPTLNYFIEVRAELLNREQARLLSGLRCSVQIGLQSADPAVLLQVDRKLDPSVFARKVGLLEDAGIIYGLDLIYGLPGDTLEGFRKSLDWALGLGPNHLDIFRLAVLPGTALHDRARELGLDRDGQAPYLVRSTPGFAAAELDRAERLAGAVDSLYNRGRAVMWFRPIASLLRKRASVIIQEWADFIDGHPAGIQSHAQIEALQVDFLRGLFSTGPRVRPGYQAATDAAVQLVRVSGAWTRAHAEGESSELSLLWPPEDLLDYAPAGIARFAAEFPRQAGRWTCEPGPDGPRFRKV
ncbi:MAG: radical SAM protein, partial [Spirochaetales bacterium]